MSACKALSAGLSNLLSGSNPHGRQSLLKGSAFMSGLKSRLEFYLRHCSVAKWCLGLWGTRQVGPICGTVGTIAQEERRWMLATNLRCNRDLDTHLLLLSPSGTTSVLLKANLTTLAKIQVKKWMYKIGTNIFSHWKKTRCPQKKLTPSSSLL